MLSGNQRRKANDQRRRHGVININGVKISKYCQQ